MHSAAAIAQPVRPCWQQDYELRGEGRERREAAAEAGDDEQPPFDRQARGCEERDRNPDEVTADEIRQQRAGRDRRERLR